MRHKLPGIKQEKRRKVSSEVEETATPLYWVAGREPATNGIDRMNRMNRIQKRLTGAGPSRFHPVNPVILSLSAISVSEDEQKAS
jgi:hypothetical protein